MLAEHPRGSEKEIEPGSNRLYDIEPVPLLVLDLVGLIDDNTVEEVANVAAPGLVGSEISKIGQLVRNRSTTRELCSLRRCLSPLML